MALYKKDQCNHNFLYVGILKKNTQNFFIIYLRNELSKVSQILFKCFEFKVKKKTKYIISLKMDERVFYSAFCLNFLPTLNRISHSVKIYISCGDRTHCYNVSSKTTHQRSHRTGGKKSSDAVRWEGSFWNEWIWPSAQTGSPQPAQ